MDQQQLTTPLLSQLQLLANRDHAPFYTPGHKQGQGINHKLEELLGNQVFKADLPELPELDNLFTPEGVIKEAQKLAASLFGAKKTWFLVNGSTSGIIASIWATCGEGDKIILPRNVHQSVIFGLILTGAIPIFINPQYNSDFDIFYGISPSDLAQTLGANSDAKAVLVVSPTYHGVCCDLQAIAHLTHSYNIPLIVDEAHGGHFHFHPQLPDSAMSVGADIAIQSTHKVLGAMTQAGMLHLQGNLVDPDRLSQGLQLVQSSSPSYLLLASLDSARHQMATEGELLLTKTIDLAIKARESLQELDYLQVLSSILNPPPNPVLQDIVNASNPVLQDIVNPPNPPLKGGDGDLHVIIEEKVPFSPLSRGDAFRQRGRNLDITRLTVKVTDLGLTGYCADEILHQKLGVTCELPSLKNLTFIISIGNQLKDIENLIKGFKQLINYQIDNQNQDNVTLPPLPHSQLVNSPRQAFQSAKIAIDISSSVNRICAEVICPYPPGIPILMPGEIITKSALEYLQRVINSGGTITGMKDPSFQTIQVKD